jgi:hypothetical protein
MVLLASKDDIEMRIEEKLAMEAVRLAATSATE